MRIKYSGKVNVKDIFNCQTCGQLSKEKYLAEPSISSLVDWSEMSLCPKCARREVGSKNKKGWDRIHEGAIK
tara:strand:+ start:363 stop:578 length:216 start_codon:yes stop_codon:yes gene_type:complete